MRGGLEVAEPLAPSPATTGTCGRRPPAPTPAIACDGPDFPGNRGYPTTASPRASVRCSSCHLRLDATRPPMAACLILRKTTCRSWRWGLAEGVSASGDRARGGGSGDRRWGLGGAHLQLEKGLVVGWSKRWCCRVGEKGRVGWVGVR